MTDAASNCCLLEVSSASVEESTGLSTGNERSVSGRTASRRPLSTAWISDEVLAETIDVWSANYGRPIDDDEAVEILMNVKRLAEALNDARKEMNHR